jgi:hypothetical protein
MAEPISHDNSKTLIYVAAGAAIVLLVVLLALGGGHNDGQPSAPSGPGNPMQTDQGR